MRSTKDMSDDSTDQDISDLSECILPNSDLVQGDLTKVECDDSSHNGGELREGERVYAILAEDGETLVTRKIACRECSAQSIYETSEKDTHLYIIEGVLEPTVCHRSNGMKITRINVLDEYVPIEQREPRV